MSNMIKAVQCCGPMTRVMGMTRRSGVYAEQEVKDKDRDMDIDKDTSQRWLAVRHFTFQNDVMHATNGRTPAARSNLDKALVVPIHPFTHSPIHPFTHSPIHPFTHSLIQF
jgi:hypothetical protein